MWFFLIGWWRTKAIRPFLYWLVELVVYLFIPTPGMAVVLVAGLGAAIALSVHRVKEAGRRAVQAAARVAGLTDEVRDAIEAQLPPLTYRPSLDEPYARRPITPPTAAYDPGALLSAVAAVLAAEGIPVDAAYGMDACAELLAAQGVTPVPGAASPTARGLVGRLTPAAHSRPYRAMPPVMLAKVILGLLMADDVMPPMSDAAGQALLDGCAVILDDLGIDPDPRAGTMADWPVMAQIIDTAAQHIEGF
jgi:hypothetical protein